MTELPAGPMAAAAPEFAPFWRRLTAFLLDAFLLYLLGLGLGAVLAPAFTAMGVWGRLVGFAVAALYFTLLDGPAGAGRTPGKRLLGLRVVDRSGAVPGWGAAGLRGALLGLCLALNGLSVLGHWYEPQMLVLEVLAAGLFITVYLTIFERRRRQGLHDLAAGTFVTRTGGAWSEPPARNPVHAYAVAAILAAFALLGAGVWGLFGSVLEPLIAVRNAVAAVAGTREVGVYRMNIHAKGRTTTQLSAAMMVYEDPGQEEGGKLINEAAAAAINSGYSFDGLDLFGVSLVTGYDIGIASSVRSHAVLLTPADWRTRLGYFGLIGPEGLDAVGLLIRAVITGSAQEVESRLAAGSDPNGKSPAGDTPLIYAAFKGRADAVKVLAAHGADANYRSPQGVTPLFVAVDRGDLPTVKALLEAGADPGSRFGNETVAEHAGKLGRPDVLALLTQAAASRPAAAVPVP